MFVKRLTFYMRKSFIVNRSDSQPQMFHLHLSYQEMLLIDNNSKVLCLHVVFVQFVADNMKFHCLGDESCLS